MGFHFESSFMEFLILIIFLNLLLLLYYRRKFNYWRNKKIPYLNPTFPFGDLKSVLLKQETLGLSIKKIYDQFKAKGAKYGGCYMFAKPIFVAVHPEIIKKILIKDFSSFQDRGVYTEEEKDPLSAHLFSIGGEQWRLLRTKLSPTFTSGKIKSMFSTLSRTGLILDETIKDITQKEDCFDIKDIAARFTTDVISSCAYGLDCSSLKNKEDEFRKYGKLAMEPDFIEGIKNLCAFVFPSVLKLVRVTLVKPKVSKFFLNVIKQTVDYRAKNNIERKDMLDLLLKLKNNNNVDVGFKINNTIADESLTFNQLAAQCYVFFLGGFETSSTVMTFCFYELTQNQDIQDKLRKEIRDVLNKYGELSYDAIMEMTYMDKVINETMRKYPPLPFLNREANENWTIPNTNITIEKGTTIFIPNFGLHYDSEYYPNPEKFDPERFSESEKSKRPGVTFLPFGDGPRNCIGMRFGFLQTKVGLATFLKNHRYTLNKKTKLPIIFDENSIILTHKYGIYLNSEKV